MPLVVKNPPANAGDVGLISGSGRSPGEGNGSPLQYSCLENPMDRGACGLTVHGVTKSQTRLSNLACMLKRAPILPKAPSQAPHTYQLRVNLLNSLIGLHSVIIFTTHLKKVSTERYAESE